MLRYLLFFYLLTFSLFADIYKDILYINSYHKGLTWSDNITKAIDERIKKEKSIELSSFYLDGKNQKDKIYIKKMIQILEHKLKKKKFDLIIVSDDYAYKLLVEKYHKLIKNIPVIFCGIENFNKNILIKNKLEDSVKGIIEKKQILKNFELIFNTQKNLKKLIIISEETLSGKANHKYILQAMEKYKNKVEFEYITKLDINEIEKKLSRYNKNVAVLYIRMYVDKDGNNIRFKKVKTIINNSKLPIYTSNTLLLKEGILGGYLNDAYKQGLYAANMAVDILNGKNIKEFNILYSSLDTHVFDYKQVLKYNINFFDLPKNSIFVNKPESFFDKYRNFINFVFILSPLLLLLFISLLITTFKKISLEKSLKIRIEFDKVLLDTVDSPVFWQNEHGDLVDCNKSFLKLIKKKKKEIIGKNFEGIIDPKNYEYLTKQCMEFLISSCESNEFVYTYKINNEEMNFFVKQSKYKDNERVLGVVSVFADITALKRVIREKNRNKQVLIQQSKLAEIGEVLRSIAHQWKAPLVDITASSQAMFFNLGGIDEKENKYLNNIMAQVLYMTQTINDFQDFLKPSLTKVELNLSKCINDVLNIINHSLRYNYIKVEVDDEIIKRCCIYAYENEFKHCLLNVLNNAKDEIILAKKEKRINKGLIKISFKIKNEFLETRILDNAGGIKEDNLEKIFKPYFSTKKDGLGIGLYMSKILIEDKLKGFISVYNEEEGACFLIKTLLVPKSCSDKINKELI